MECIIYIASIKEKINVYKKATCYFHSLYDYFMANYSNCVFAYQEFLGFEDLPHAFTLLRDVFWRDCDDDEYACTKYFLVTITTHCLRIFLMNWWDKESNDVYINAPMRKRILKRKCSKYASGFFVVVIVIEKCVKKLNEEAGRFNFSFVDKLLYFISSSMELTISLSVSFLWELSIVSFSRGILEWSNVRLHWLSISQDWLGEGAEI